MVSSSSILKVNQIQEPRFKFNQSNSWELIVEVLICAFLALKELIVKLQPTTVKTVKLALSRINRNLLVKNALKIISLQITDQFVNLALCTP
jgi:hypothetical protein